ncbi:uncharacterized protein LOC122132740, partial [Clupea harengus]|uniref:Uncharacterized protein LOC122132740 n=1 Tax=Clupea harengus TaxID=7950 RepID=A0A8M1KNG3_CLUHA
GLFGQCLASQQELVHYQVSVPVLHRLQEVLKELMVQGLTWKDDITQYIISQELKDVPLARPSLKPGSSSPQKLSERSKSSPNLQRLGPRLPPQPNRGQHYLDYTIVEPPQSPLHLQSLDPYTYQQKYSYQDDQERSLNSVDGGQYPRPSSQSGASRGGPPALRIWTDKFCRTWCLSTCLPPHPRPPATGWQHLSPPHPSSLWTTRRTTSPRTSRSASSSSSSSWIGRLHRATTLRGRWM